MTGTRNRPYLLAVVVCLFLLLGLESEAQAQGEVNACSVPFNISNSDKYASIDPLLLPDPSGVVHLFWAERQTGVPDSLTDIPDSLMYATWDGQSWTAPLDIFISPPEYYNAKIGGIRATLDDQGGIHLVWMGPDNTFYYSSARADAAGSAQAWQLPYLLAEDQVGVQYSVDIAYTPPNTLHVLYGRSPDNTNDLLSYIRSDDGGSTWSRPRDLHIARALDRGFSNVRFRVSEPDKLYATWTEWDETGNGQGIYFIRSLDAGATWEAPVLLDERVGDEYTRDWTNLALLGEDELVAFWVGGYRAYPQAQYSYDGGVSWSEPIDTFPWLIADNGYAEFVRDSNNELHLFISRRIREGYVHLCGRFAGCEGEGNAIWHSVWEGGTKWREPQPVGGFHRTNFTAAALTNGNDLVLAWFTYLGRDIMVQQCAIEDAPPVASQPWPTITPAVSVPPSPTPEASPITATPAPTPIFGPDALATEPPAGQPLHPARGMLYGVMPSLMFLVLVVIVRYQRRR